MRLLNSESKQLESFGRRPPPYAIVSHRWGATSEEVLFDDIGDIARVQSKAKGYEKILGSCAHALQDDLNYVWLDTCCIDKTDSTELTEVINSMYEFYHESEVCYVYLHDVSDSSESKFVESNWFTRGWTLQELIAPRHLKFFTKDWILIGTREELVDAIAKRTGINHQVLQAGKIPPEVTVSQRMVWAAQRETTMPEDKAYSLLGILGINMLPIYGVGDGAFEDLQHRIIARYNDQTLFSWYNTNPGQASGSPKPVKGGTSTPSLCATGLLALPSSRYLKSYEISEADFRKNYVDGIMDHNYQIHFYISNNLVHVFLPIKHLEGKIWKAVLRCSLEAPNGDVVQRPLAIYLEEVHPWRYIRVHLPGNGELADDEAYGVRGVPGSLERLSDAELRLEGYVLRNIDVIGSYGELPQEDKQRPSSESTPVDLRVNITREGDYPVAAGGFADIYKGTLLCADRAAIKVAIKAIKVYSGEDADPKKAKTLRREIKVWMKIKHSNILPLLGTTSGFGPFPAMVCPWLENGTLTSYLERFSATLGIRHILALIHDVASGLQHLHSQSIAHGDLSGSNVLIDADGKACIADFGLSTLLTEIGSTLGSSSTGKPRGTLRWAAPEMLGLLDQEDAIPQHSKPTTQCDVYSFGGIMLQILSGKIPYHYYSYDGRIIAAMFRGETPTRPDTPHVTDRRWEFIQRCWSPFRNAAQRPCGEELVAFSLDDLARHSS